MKLSISKDADPNYLASVVECPEIKDHPNGQNLSLVSLFGNTIIIAKDMYVQGEKVVYFPVESCLKSEFLSWANLFDNQELNEDRVTKGFFSNKGCRVKAVRLRQIPSQGFLYKVSKLADYYKTSEKDFVVGTSFNMVGSDVLVTKYVKPEKTAQGANVKKVKIPQWVNAVLGRLPRPVRKIAYVPIKWYYRLNPDEGIKKQILEGQFRFHYHTEHLGKNLFALNPEDDITISSKFHGTSFIAGNLFCRYKAPWYKRTFSKEYNEYKLIYSSRSVLKNRRDGTYTQDVYGVEAEKLEGKIPGGILVFGEIVGWVNAGKQVQKGYTYGVKQGESELRVYRMGKVDKLGQYVEFDWNQIEIFCANMELKTVPVYYKGLAKDMFPDIQVDDNWRQNFLDALKNKYLDKPCEFCNTGIVNEGVVLKINNRETKPVFKFKSPKFVEKESKDRDTGEPNIDEEN
jgi:hypothetical protein